jgi:hypothetical protein
MKGIVDRIEGEYAVVETDKGMVDILLAWFDEVPKDGDAVSVDYGNMKAVVEKGETEKLEDEVRILMDDLFE